MEIGIGMVEVIMRMVERVRQRDHHLELLAPPNLSIDLLPLPLPLPLPPQGRILQGQREI